MAGVGGPGGRESGLSWLGCQGWAGCGSRPGGVRGWGLGGGGEGWQEGISGVEGGLGWKGLRGWIGGENVERVSKMFSLILARKSHF